MRVAVMGPRGYGSWRIRGGPLAAANDWDVLDVSRPVPRHYDVIWLVKRRLGRPLPGNLRQSCDRLILDPLDYWASPSSVDPVKCWRQLWHQIPFDDLIATSPACQQVMQEGLYRNIKVHLLPHQCDGRIPAAGWYDPEGPIVYSGSEAYIRPIVPALQNACREIGREFRPDFSQHHSWQNLRGASLVLSLRVGRHDCPFTRFCKPQIKLENAAAAGIPVLCDGHPCQTSLHPDAPMIGSRLDPPALRDALRHALRCRPLRSRYRPGEFFEDARQIVEGVPCAT
jgi:hypothetical protein